MAQSSQQILQQMKAYAGTDLPMQIEQGVKKAYEGPMKQLIQEGNTARNNFYPSFFNAAQTYGTGAGDMSPGAKLSAMMGDVDRSGNAYRTNLGLRDYYGTMVNDLVGKAQNGLQMGYGNLKDLYSATFGQEQADEQRRAAGRASASQNSLANLLKQLSMKTSAAPKGYMNPNQGIERIGNGQYGAETWMQNGSVVGGQGPDSALMDPRSNRMAPRASLGFRV